MTREINDAGLSLIKQYEGCRLDVYADIAGIPTVGFGHKILPDDNLNMGDFITQDQASEFLANDLAAAENAVCNAITVDLNDNQYASLVSLCYNAGAGAVQGTIGKLLNAGDYESASEFFLRWCHATINDVLVVSQALLNRRIAERNLFELPISN